MAPTDLPSTDPVPVPDGPHEWHRLLGADELAGRVTTIEVGRRTLCVSGVDGSFGVLDNRCPQQGPGSTNLLTGQQRAAPLDVWQTPLQNPDFAALRRRPTSAKASVAELCGTRGLSVRESGELDDAVADGLAADGPALVHIRTDVRLV